MKISIRKTDKRFTGSDVLRYVVDIKVAYSVPMINGTGRKTIRLKKFQEVRQWCIDTFGMSCERDHYLHLLTSDPDSVNSRWCWHTEFHDTKIYFASEKEANWFKLKWL